MGTGPTTGRIFEKRWTQALLKKGRKPEAKKGEGSREETLRWLLKLRKERKGM